MNIVMPLAGRGGRFWEVGYSVPKPLVKVKNKLMVEWAVKCLTLDLSEHKLIFVILKEHAERYRLNEELQKLYPKSIILQQNGYKNGALLSVLEVRKLIDSKEPLIICNGDQYFKADLENAFKKQVDGFIPIFNATHSRWSYAKTDDNNRVIQVAEKIPISTNATVGLYYFKQGSDFVWAADKMLQKDIRRGNEFYIAPVFNELIEIGKKIITIKADFMYSLGTPEDVEHFERYYRGSD